MQKRDGWLRALARGLCTGGLALGLSATALAETGIDAELLERSRTWVAAQQAAHHAAALTPVAPLVGLAQETAERMGDALERGQASWYGPRFHRKRTASGEVFDMHALTAAHPTLPFGTEVCVQGLQTGRSVLVRINDRGPHIGGRIIDLSRAAAQRLGLLQLGTKAVALVEPLVGRRCPGAR